MKNHSIFNRLVSACLVSALTVAFHVQAPAIVQAAPDTIRLTYQPIPNELGRMAPPEKIGKLLEVHKGNNRDTIILVQDAHAIPDAQRSIQQLIEHYQTQYGVNTIAVEGASAALDAQVFRSFPDQDILKEIFEDYFNKGELAGSVAAAIFNQGDSLYHGIEDWDLYEEGLAYFLSSMHGEVTALDKIAELKTQLDYQKREVYSQELLEVDRALEDFRANFMDLIPTISQLAKYKMPAKDSEVYLLYQEAQQHHADQSSLDYEVKKVALQVKAFFDRFPPRGDKREDIQLFHEKFQAFQTSRLSPQEFALLLKEWAIKYQIRVRVSKKLDFLVRRQKRVEDIKGTRLFREFENYAESVKESLFKSGEERVLDTRGEQLYLLEKLSKLEITREDWDEIKEFVSESGQVLSDNVFTESDLVSFLKNMQPNLAFYVNAERRDEMFLEKLNELLEKQGSDKPRTAVMVAGGFHTEGLISRLKEQGSSYVLLMPQIGTIPEVVKYKDHMRGDVTWGDYIEVEDGKVNIYAAFIRGTRDRILTKGMERVPGKPIKGKGRILKEWRDEIIRDLAEKGRIIEAGSYTSLIDELIEDKQQQLPAWVKQIDSFVDGLKRLEQTGQLTEQNIVGLLNPATIIGGKNGTATMDPNGRLANAFGTRDLGPLDLAVREALLRGERFVPSGYEATTAGLLVPKGQAEKFDRNEGHEKKVVGLDQPDGLVKTAGGVDLLSATGTLKGVAGTGLITDGAAATAALDAAQRVEAAARRGELPSVPGLAPDGRSSFLLPNAADPAAPVTSVGAIDLSGTGIQAGSGIVSDPSQLAAAGAKLDGLTRPGTDVDAGTLNRAGELALQTGAQRVGTQRQQFSDAGLTIPGIALPGQAISGQQLPGGGILPGGINAGTGLFGGDRLESREGVLVASVEDLSLPGFQLVESIKGLIGFEELPNGIATADFEDYVSVTDLKRRVGQVNALMQEPAFIELPADLKQELISLKNAATRLAFDLEVYGPALAKRRQNVMRLYRTQDRPSIVARLSFRFSPTGQRVTEESLEQAESVVRARERLLRGLSDGDVIEVSSAEAGEVFQFRYNAAYRVLQSLYADGEVASSYPVSRLVGADANGIRQFVFAPSKNALEALDGEVVRVNGQVVVGEESQAVQVEEQVTTTESLFVEPTDTSVEGFRQKLADRNASQYQNRVRPGEVERLAFVLGNGRVTEGSTAAAEQAVSAKENLLRSLRDGQTVEVTGEEGTFAYRYDASTRRLELLDNDGQPLAEESYAVGQSVGINRTTNQGVYIFAPTKGALEILDGQTIRVDGVVIISRLESRVKVAQDLTRTLQFTLNLMVEQWKSQPVDFARDPNSQIEVGNPADVFERHTEELLYAEDADVDTVANRIDDFAREVNGDLAQYGLLRVNEGVEGANRENVAQLVGLLGRVSEFLRGTSEETQDELIAAIKELYQPLLAPMMNVILRDNASFDSGIFSNSRIVNRVVAAYDRWQGAGGLRSRVADALTLRGFSRATSAEFRLRDRIPALERNLIHRVPELRFVSTSADAVQAVESSQESLNSLLTEMRETLGRGFIPAGDSANFFREWLAENGEESLPFVARTVVNSIISYHDITSQHLVQSAAREADGLRPVNFETSDQDRLDAANQLRTIALIFQSFGDLRTSDGLTLSLNDQAGNLLDRAIANAEKLEAVSMPAFKMVPRIYYPTAAASDVVGSPQIRFPVGDNYARNESRVTNALSEQFLATEQTNLDELITALQDILEAEQGFIEHGHEVALTGLAADVSEAIGVSVGRDNFKLLNVEFYQALVDHFTGIQSLGQQVLDAQIALRFTLQEDDFTNVRARGRIVEASNLLSVASGALRVGNIPLARLNWTLARTAVEVAMRREIPVAQGPERIQRAFTSLRAMNQIYADVFADESLLAAAYRLESREVTVAVEAITELAEEGVIPSEEIATALNELEAQLTGERDSIDPTVVFLETANRILPILAEVGGVDDTSVINTSEFFNDVRLGIAKHQLAKASATLNATTSVLTFSSRLGEDSQVFDNMRTLASQAALDVAAAQGLLGSSFGADLARNYVRSAAQKVEQARSLNPGNELTGLEDSRVALSVALELSEAVIAGEETVALASGLRAESRQQTVGQARVATLEQLYEYRDVTDTFVDEDTGETVTSAHRGSFVNTELLANEIGSLIEIEEVSGERDVRPGYVNVRLQYQTKRGWTRVEFSSSELSAISVSDFDSKPNSSVASGVRVASVTSAEELTRVLNAIASNPVAMGLLSKESSDAQVQLINRMLRNAKLELAGVGLRESVQLQTAVSNDVKSATDIRKSAESQLAKLQARDTTQPLVVLRNLESTHEALTKARSRLRESLKRAEKTASASARQIAQRELNASQQAIYQLDEQIKQLEERARSDSKSILADMRERLAKISEVQERGDLAAAADSITALVSSLRSTIPIVDEILEFRNARGVEASRQGQPTAELEAQVVYWNTLGNTLQTFADRLDTAKAGMLEELRAQPSERTVGETEEAAAPQETEAVVEDGAVAVSLEEHLESPNHKRTVQDVMQETNFEIARGSLRGAKLFAIRVFPNGREQRVPVNPTQGTGQEFSGPTFYAGRDANGSDVVRLDKDGSITGVPGMRTNLFRYSEVVRVELDRGGATEVLYDADETAARLESHLEADASDTLQALSGSLDDALEELNQQERAIRESAQQAVEETPEQPLSTATPRQVNARVAQMVGEEVFNRLQQYGIWDQIVADPLSAGRLVRELVQSRTMAEWMSLSGVNPGVLGLIDADFAALIDDDERLTGTILPDVESYALAIVQREMDEQAAAQEAEAVEQEVSGEEESLQQLMEEQAAQEQEVAQQQTDDQTGLNEAGLEAARQIDTSAASAAATGEGEGDAGDGAADVTVSELPGLLQFGLFLGLLASIARVVRGGKNSIVPIMVGTAAAVSYVAGAIASYVFLATFSFQFVIAGISITIPFGAIAGVIAGVYLVYSAVGAAWQGFQISRESPKSSEEALNQAVSQARRSWNPLIFVRQFVGRAMQSQMRDSDGSAKARDDISSSWRVGLTATGGVLVLASVLTALFISPLAATVGGIAFALALWGAFVEVGQFSDTAKVVEEKAEDKTETKEEAKTTDETTDAEKDADAEDKTEDVQAEYENLDELLQAVDAHVQVPLARRDAAWIARAEALDAQLEAEASKRQAEAEPQFQARMQALNEQGEEAVSAEAIDARVGDFLAVDEDGQLTDQEFVNFALENGIEDTELSADNEKLQGLARRVAVNQLIDNQANAIRQELIDSFRFTAINEAKETLEAATLTAQAEGFITQLGTAEGENVVDDAKVHLGKLQEAIQRRQALRQQMQSAGVDDAPVLAQIEDLNDAVERLQQALDQVGTPVTPLEDVVETEETAEQEGEEEARMDDEARQAVNDQARQAVNQARTVADTVQAQGEELDDPAAVESLRDDLHETLQSDAENLDADVVEEANEVLSSLNEALGQDADAVQVTVEETADEVEAAAEATEEAAEDVEAAAETTTGEDTEAARPAKPIVDAGDDEDEELELQLADEVPADPFVPLPDTLQQQVEGIQVAVVPSSDDINLIVINATFHSVGGPNEVTGIQQVALDLETAPERLNARFDEVRKLLGRPGSLWSLREVLRDWDAEMSAVYSLLGELEDNARENYEEAVRAGDQEAQSTWAGHLETLRSIETHYENYELAVNAFGPKGGPTLGDILNARDRQLEIQSDLDRLGAELLSFNEFERELGLHVEVENQITLLNGEFITLEGVLSDFGRGLLKEIEDAEEAQETQDQAEDGAEAVTTQETVATTEVASGTEATDTAPAIEDATTTDEKQEVAEDAQATGDVGEQVQATGDVGEQVQAAEDAVVADADTDVEAEAKPQFIDVSQAIGDAIVAVTPIATPEALIAAVSQLTGEGIDSALAAFPTPLQASDSPEITNLLQLVDAAIRDNQLKGESLADFIQKVTVTIDSTAALYENQRGPFAPPRIPIPALDGQMSAESFQTRNMTRQDMRHFDAVVGARGTNLVLGGEDATVGGEIRGFLMEVVGELDAAGYSPEEIAGVINAATLTPLGSRLVQGSTSEVRVYKIEVKMLDGTKRNAKLNVRLQVDADGKEKLQVEFRGYSPELNLAQGAIEGMKHPITGETGLQAAFSGVPLDAQSKVVNVKWNPTDANGNPLVKNLGEGDLVALLTLTDSTTGERHQRLLVIQPEEGTVRDSRGLEYVSVKKRDVPVGFRPNARVNPQIDSRTSLDQDRDGHQRNPDPSLGHKARLYTPATVAPSIGVAPSGAGVTEIVADYVDSTEAATPEDAVSVTEAVTPTITSLTPAQSVAVQENYIRTHIRNSLSVSGALDGLTPGEAEFVVGFYYDAFVVPVVQIADDGTETAEIFGEGDWPTAMSNVSERLNGVPELAAKFQGRSDTLQQSVAKAGAAIGDIGVVVDNAQRFTTVVEGARTGLDSLGYYSVGQNDVADILAVTVAAAHVTVDGEGRITPWAVNTPGDVVRVQSGIAGDLQREGNGAQLGLVQTVMGEDLTGNQFFQSDNAAIQFAGPGTSFENITLPIDRPALATSYDAAQSAYDAVVSDENSTFLDLQDVRSDVRSAEQSYKAALSPSFESDTEALDHIRTNNARRAGEIGIVRARADYVDARSNLQVALANFNDNPAPLNLVLVNEAFEEYAQASDAFQAAMAGVDGWQITAGTYGNERVDLAGQVEQARQQVNLDGLSEQEAVLASNVTEARGELVGVLQDEASYDLTLREGEPTAETARAVANRRGAAIADAGQAYDAAVGAYDDFLRSANRFDEVGALESERVGFRDLRLAALSRLDYEVALDAVAINNATGTASSGEEMDSFETSYATYETEQNATGIPVPETVRVNHEEQRRQALQLRRQSLAASFDSVSRELTDLAGAEATSPYQIRAAYRRLESVGRDYIAFLNSTGLQSDADAANGIQQQLDAAFQVADAAVVRSIQFADEQELAGKRAGESQAFQADVEGLVEVLDQIESGDEVVVTPDNVVASFEELAEAYTETLQDLGGITEDDVAEIQQRRDEITQLADDAITVVNANRREDAAVAFEGAVVQTHDDLVAIEFLPAIPATMVERAEELLAGFNKQADAYVAVLGEMGPLLAQDDINDVQQTRIEFANRVSQIRDQSYADERAAVQDPFDAAVADLSALVENAGNPGVFVDPSALRAGIKAVDSATFPYRNLLNERGEDVSDIQAAEELVVRAENLITERTALTSDFGIGIGPSDVGIDFEREEAYAKYQSNIAEATGHLIDIEDKVRVEEEADAKGEAVLSRIGELEVEQARTLLDDVNQSADAYVEALEQTGPVVQGELNGVQTTRDQFADRVAAIEQRVQTNVYRAEADTFGTILGLAEQEVERGRPLSEQDLSDLDEVHAEYEEAANTYGSQLAARPENINTGIALGQERDAFAARVEGVRVASQPDVARPLFDAGVSRDYETDRGTDLDSLDRQQRVSAAGNVYSQAAEAFRLQLEAAEAQGRLDGTELVALEDTYATYGEFVEAYREVLEANPTESFNQQIELRAEQDSFAARMENVRQFQQPQTSLPIFDAQVGIRDVDDAGVDLADFGRRFELAGALREGLSGIKEPTSRVVVGRNHDANEFDEAVIAVAQRGGNIGDLHALLDAVFSPASASVLGVSRQRVQLVDRSFAVDASKRQRGEAKAVRKNAQVFLGDAEAFDEAVVELAEQRGLSVPFDAIPLVRFLATVDVSASVGEPALALRFDPQRQPTRREREGVSTREIPRTAKARNESVVGQVQQTLGALQGVVEQVADDVEVIVGESVQEVADEAMSASEFDEFIGQLSQNIASDFFNELERRENAVYRDALADISVEVNVVVKGEQKRLEFTVSYGVGMTSDRTDLPDKILVRGNIAVNEEVDAAVLRRFQTAIEAAVSQRRDALLGVTRGIDAIEQATEVGVTVRAESRVVTDIDGFTRVQELAAEWVQFFQDAQGNVRVKADIYRMARGVALAQVTNPDAMNNFYAAIEAIKIEALSREGIKLTDAQQVQVVQGIDIARDLVRASVEAIAKDGLFMGGAMVAINLTPAGNPEILTDVTPEQVAAAANRLGEIVEGLIIVGDQVPFEMSNRNARFRTSHFRKATQLRTPFSQDRTGHLALVSTLPDTIPLSLGDGEAVSALVQGSILEVLMMAGGLVGVHGDKLLENNAALLKQMLNEKLASLLDGVISLEQTVDSEGNVKTSLKFNARIYQEKLIDLAIATSA